MRKYAHFLSFTVIAFIVFSIFYDSRQAKESFTYFPTDPNAFFHTADTSLSLLENTEDGYKIEWRIHSLLDRKAYLRQDIGLLYVNGLLKEKIGKSWKQFTDKINLKKAITNKEAANYKAISFHHAEIHTNQEITSSQKLSHDELYVLDSNFSPLHSFRQPISKEEKDWKNMIDELINKRFEDALVLAEKKYQIEPERYTIVPLTEIYRYAEKPLLGFTAKETNEIIGRLWEGLYKNYFLSIKNIDGTETDPIGSTIPLIMIAKNKSHLLVISKLKTGEVMLLKQLIPNH